ncbi:MAG: recombination-associated protein RdgC [Gammaproteobacteria bacterium]|jgi:recombination associated protein RdgC|nr:recombination-associated protein RdgC [Gammaproteobacteria bacterium]
MWFKNIRVFCLTQTFDLSAEELESQLADNAFIPCANYEKSRMAWVSPLGDAAPELAEDQEPMLTHIVGDYIMLCAQKQERLLPASVVREATAEKVTEIESRQARKVYRKEKREIQDNMYASLLPRAFTRSARTYAYISRADKLLVVDAVSAPKAEEFINLLRDSLGSFPVALPDSKRAPSDVMTRWLVEQKATDKFEIHNDCELFNPLDGSNMVRCKGQDLVSDEIKAHLEAGKRAKQLSVVWNNALSCSIVEDLSLKRLRFEDINEESASFAEESAAQKFDQEFVLMTLQLTAFFKSFFEAFGGLEDPKNKMLPDNRSKEDS